MFFFCSSVASLDRNEPGNLVYLKHLTRENKRSGSLDSSSDSGFCGDGLIFSSLLFVVFGNRHVTLEVIVSTSCRDASICRISPRVVQKKGNGTECRTHKVYCRVNVEC